MTTTFDALSEAQKQLRENFMRDSENALNVIFPALVEKANEVCSKLPEHIFVQYFLPYFAGQIDLSSRPGLMAEWISVAGSPMAEVAIIDNNWNVLYYVPGVFDTSFIDIRSRENVMSFKNITDQAAMMSSNLPVLGDRFLTNSLGQKFNNMVDTMTSTDYNRQRWMSIFSRYGIAHASQPAQASMQSVSNITHDEIYD